MDKDELIRLLDMVSRFDYSHLTAEQIRIIQNIKDVSDVKKLTDEEIEALSEIQICGFDY
ncbi:MAG: hypothetical protein MJZ00_07010 [Paludibacteraceae bacterium]|nr:hypothetical protein [Paludibacteraceae bacterium]